jgi:hypothetical protein
VLFEPHLQRVLGEPAFGWDWAADGELSPTQQPLAPIWSNDYLGVLIHQLQMVPLMKDRGK